MEPQPRKSELHYLRCITQTPDNGMTEYHTFHSYTCSQNCKLVDICMSATLFGLHPS